MKKNVERTVAFLVVAACVFTVYIGLPFSPSLKMPRPKALAHQTSYGCGGFSFGGSGTTLFYPKLKADMAMRNNLNEDLLRQGFEKTEQAGKIRYEKSTGGLVVSRAFLTIHANGSITSGASLTKWPF